MQRQKTTLRIAVLFLATILVMVSMPATALAITADAPSEAVTIDGEEYVSQIFEWESEEKINAVNEIIPLIVIEGNQEN